MQEPQILTIDFINTIIDDIIKIKFNDINRFNKTTLKIKKKELFIFPTSTFYETSRSTFNNEIKMYLEYIISKTNTSKNIICIKPHPGSNSRKTFIIEDKLKNEGYELFNWESLFNIKDNQINAIIHPESIIHAAINFHDNTSISLLNEPDMKIPISYLLGLSDKYSKYDNIFQHLSKKSLTFRKIEHKKFPAIRLAYKVLELGGLAPHIFNYNNEVLVNNFLQKNIKFKNIVKYNEITLKKFFKYNKNIKNPNLNDIYNTSIWINKNIFLGKI